MSISPTSSPILGSKGISDLAPADSVLSVQNVSKKFCRNLKRSYVYGLRDIFCEVVGKGRRSDRLRDREFWSVRNVSMEVKKGQSIGLVGVNGSGKSTLLRMISGLMKPDTGRIVVRGRIAALIALGAGFNPLLSGRENVFINMAILGLSRDDIQARFKDVVDFAEVWEAIEAPVRTYSSGMRARLGFACAIFTDPDILLLDEVLAVGDAMFRAKCYRQLAMMRERGTSFFLVSHNSNAILNLCNTAVFLQKGKVIMQGSAEDVIGRYELALGDYKQKKAQKKAIAADGKGAEENGAKENRAEQATDSSQAQTELSIESFDFIDEHNQPTKTLASGQSATLRIRCQVQEPIESAVVHVIIREPTKSSECTLNMNSDRDGQTFNFQPGLEEIRLHFPQCGLRPNAYLIKVTISRRPFYVFDISNARPFEVEPNQNMNQCQFYQPRQWSRLTGEADKTEHSSDSPVSSHSSSGSSSGSSIGSPSDNPSDSPSDTTVPPTENIDELPDVTTDRSTDCSTGRSTEQQTGDAYQTSTINPSST